MTTPIERRAHAAGQTIKRDEDPQQYAEYAAARRQQRITFLQAEIVHATVVLENLQAELAVLRSQ